jgi:hypothetical protein
VWKYPFERGGGSVEPSGLVGKVNKGEACIVKIMALVMIKSRIVGSVQLDGKLKFAEFEA